MLEELMCFVMELMHFLVLVQGMCLPGSAKINKNEIIQRLSKKQKHLIFSVIYSSTSRGRNVSQVRKQIATFFCQDLDCHVWRKVLSQL